MARTITGTLTTGVSLTNPADNPVTIASGADIAYGNFALRGAAAVAWTITNLGTVGTNGGSGGVLLLGSGKVVNGAATAASALIQGTSAVYIVGSGTVTNFGTLTGDVHTGDNSRLANAASSAAVGGHVVMGAHSTIINSGTIAGGVGTAVGISLGSQLTNGGPGGHIALISGAAYAVSVQDNGSTLTNNARIQASLYGIALHGSDKVINTGTISSGTAGIKLFGSDVISNSGAIGGGTFGLLVQGSGSTITNTGSIGASSTAIFGLGGLSATTIVNGGTISGGTAAVNVQSGETTLKLLPGAVFNGVVKVAATATNLLELGALPNKIGTLGGLDALAGAGQFNFFHNMAVDAAAKWQLTGTNTLADNSGNGVGLALGAAGKLTVLGTANDRTTLHLSGSGTLAVGATGQINVGLGAPAHNGTIAIGTQAAGGAIYGSGVLGGPVTNNGVIQASGGTLAVTGSIGGSGTVKIAPGAVLTATGALANPAAFLPGGHETLGLGAPGLDVSPISGFAATDSIDLIGKIATTFHFGGADVLTLANAGGAVAALHFAPGLTAADFSLLPDGHGGTFILHT